MEVSNVTTEVDQFPITYEASVLTDYGVTSLTNTLVFSPGGLTSGNADTVFQQQASNPLASARYAYDMLNIVQMTRLPYDASWVDETDRAGRNHQSLAQRAVGRRRP